MMMLKMNLPPSLKIGVEAIRPRGKIVARFDGMKL